MLISHRQGLNAWTASENDFDQQLVIDFGTVKNITRITTQGRAHSQEYVQEYRISYGSNGLDYVQYKAAEGEVKVNYSAPRELMI